MLNEMNFLNAQAAVEKLNARYSGRFVFSLQEVTKVNVTVEQVYITRLDENGHEEALGIGITLTNDMFTRRESIEELLAKYVESELVKESCREEALRFVEAIKQYDAIKNDIILCVCNAKNNEQLAEDIPHKVLLDLMVYYRVYRRTEEEDMSLIVKNEHLKMWGISSEEIHRQAMENDSESTIFFRSMNGLLQDLWMRCFGIKTTDIEDGGMYVLSRKTGSYGAGLIAREDILKSLAENGECDILVLPSSIHELFLLPFNEEEGVDLEMVNDMVREVNSSHVEPAERLADHVYIYRRDLNALLDPLVQDFSYAACN